MMLSNLLRSKVHIQVRSASRGPLGETITWKPVMTRFARVVPLSAQVRADHQQLGSVVSHKIIFRGSVSLTLGGNRFLWKDKTFEPVEPSEEIEGFTSIVVKET